MPCRLFRQLIQTFGFFHKISEIHTIKYFNIMGKKTSNILVYPTQGRIQRQKTGGILFIALGLILITFGLTFGETFLYFFGIPLSLIGLFINGYRKTTKIDLGTLTVQSIRGLYFFIRKNEYQCNSFDKIVIRKSKFLSSRFSNISSSRYKSTVKISYKLYLSGDNEIEIDSSNEIELTKKWGKQISNKLNLDIYLEDEKEDKEKDVRNKVIAKLASITIFFIVLGIMAFVAYQLFTIE